MAAKELDGLKVLCPAPASNPVPDLSPVLPLKQETTLPKM